MSRSNPDLEAIVRSICDEYVRRWKTKGKKYISVPSFEQIYAEGCITPIELEYTLKNRLPILNKENSAIPPAIPLLPLSILRRLAIYMTKTLEIQVNWDHYEYWAWSAEVFRALENSSFLLKNLCERGVIDLLYLLFHISLSKLGYTPQTLEAAILNRVVDIVVSSHVKHVITNKFVIGIPIGAATFETVIKLISELYGDAKIKGKLEKATLGKALQIFENDVIPHLPQHLQSDIKEINTIIESIWRTYGSNWRKILINWRNKFMHGAKTWAPRAFAVYTNYVCLLLWHSISDEEYEQVKKKILIWKTHRSVDDCWGSYPPPI